MPSVGTGDGPLEALTVPGRLEALSTVGHYVMRVAASAGLDKATAYRLRLSVDEIVTNIIVHGYEEAGRTGEVALTAAVDARELAIRVEDSAAPFDPRDRPPPDRLDKPLEERDIGGLGVYLAIDGVDAYRYERVGDRNHNILIMHRPAAATLGVAEGAH